MRPANIVTAVADILAGVAIAGIAINQFAIDLPVTTLIGLIIATIGLYGGGVVFNDFFDAALDKIERPERPIPSGRVSKQNAFILGATLLLLGIIAATYVSYLSGIIAVAISFFALFYDKYAKHSIVFGPLFMGLCRSLNLLLGMSILLPGLETHWYMALLPLAFIAAITLTSQGEVKGGNKGAVAIALILDVVILSFLMGLAYNSVMDFYSLIPFALLWTIMNGYALIKALKNNTSANIMNAVKMGVLSLIPLNASYAAGFGGFQVGLIVLALLPVSIVLSKKFAVT